VCRLRRVPLFGCPDQLDHVGRFSSDTQTFYGTFINGDRLSLEGLESEPYQLKSDDTVVSLQLYSDLSL
jgi:hypothetical protein